MPVRDYGFKEIFKRFDHKDVEALLDYHRLNGGLSRYVKIKYFFESVLNQSITDTEVLEYAVRFSEIMRKELIDPKNLINDSVHFIKENHTNFNFHIVSGSDQEELRFLCNELNISNYFITINGSPTAKKQLVKNLLKKYNYNTEETCLIGDSVNDYEAAKENQISFFGYNNVKLLDLRDNYISVIRNYKFNESK